MTARTGNKDVAQTDLKSDSLRGRPGLGLTGFLVVEMIIGYEWLISGLTKFVRGDFPSGLAAEMQDKVGDAVSWYAGFLNAIVIPNAAIFGYVIETAEILVGVALLVGPLLWLFAWDRLPDRFRSTLVFLIAGAAIGGIFMALNFHLANGNTHPWLLPADSFDEGVDFDALLAILDIVLATVNTLILSRLRRESVEASAVRSEGLQPRYTR